MSEWFSRQALGSLPADAARRWSAREALSFQGRRWTFAELSERVDRVAQGLMGLVIAPGEHVALWMVNRPEFIDAAFAVMKIGAVLVPINTRFRTEDLAYVLAQSDASTLLIAERSGPVNYLGMVRQLAPSLETARAGEVREARFPRWKRVVVAAAEPRPEMLDWRALVRAGEQVDDVDLRNRAAAVDPEAAAFIMYTSGTTGFPKGAMHCHRIVRNLVDRAFRLAITPADTIMMYLPLFHLFGFSEGMLMSMVTGARQILTETFDPPAILALMAEERPTILHGVDPATGREQPGGTPGEIRVRSYMTMQRYYKRPEETAKTIDPEGWVHTGDMGLIRADGHLRFLGRYKDMLKIGGENVDPMEVEAFLMGHPAINLAAVVAFPDARLSEVGVAFVRLEPGEALGEAEVIDYCRDKIASFKIPRHVIFVAEFPMTGSGKIQKAKLREEALAQFTPG